MAYLRIVRDGQLEGQVELTGTIIRIGRDASNDVVLEDPTKWVSRSHAEIRVQGSTYTIVDLGTPNGIRVNRQQAAQAILSSGTSIEIGPYQLQFVADSPAPVAAGDVTVLSPGKGTRAAAPPVAGRAKVPPVPVPRQPMGKIARQALTFVGIVIVVAVVATIDAHRPTPKPPAALDTGVSAPPPPPPPVGNQEPATAPTVPEKKDESDRPKAKPVETKTASTDDPDIPRTNGESNPSYNQRSESIRQFWREANNSYSQGIDPTQQLNEINKLQSQGYLTSKEFLDRVKRGLDCIQQAVVESQKGEDAKLTIVTAKLTEARNYLNSASYTSAITTLNGKISADLARIAQDLFDGVKEYYSNLDHDRSGEYAKRLVTTYGKVCNLVAASTELYRTADQRLKDLKK